jgi:trehalose 6-phosphate phosphatase
MEILNNKTDLNQFFSLLKSAEDRILMLDYDGTLAPFNPDRNKAYPYPKAAEIVNRILVDNSCRVIIISGRTIEDLLNLIEFESMPEIWGSHGYENKLPGGTYYTETISGDAKETIRLYEEAFRIADLEKYCEKKSFGIAVHWRGCSNEQINKIKTKVDQIASKIKNYSVNVADFDGGKEIRIKGIDKGSAVNKIMSTAMAGSVSAYLGDDLTDEDAFRQMGDTGLKVLVRDKPRATLADIRLVPPDDLVWFLEKWRDLCMK